jgi:hypothetical protein
MCVLPSLQHYSMADVLVNERHPEIKDARSIYFLSSVELYPLYVICVLRISTIFRTQNQLQLQNHTIQ